MENNDIIGGKIEDLQEILNKIYVALWGIIITLFFLPYLIAKQLLH